jgi:2-keto-4-pentenoate hydratase/2-oxohepta-3-ene-1,7-dioic acid hydratase in catechol pathway
MRIRRNIIQGQPSSSSLQIEEGGRWRDATEPERQAWDWLPPPDLVAAREIAGSGSAYALPFQPRSFRDCTLYERHWIQASRGYAKRFLPASYRLASAYERLTGRVFPGYRLKPIAYLQPIYYFGNHVTIVPSGVAIRIPSFTKAFDYELELGTVLKAPLRNATPDEALAAIGGFVVVNDWSSRDLQRAEMRSGLGPQKAKHPITSMSLELAAAADILPRVESLAAHVEINGKTIARTATSGMLHGWGQTLSHLSREETLLPGELVATGTLPDGAAMETGTWLKPGDRLRLVIDDVGEIIHPVLS